MNRIIKSTTSKIILGFILGASAVGGIATAAGTLSSTVSSACVDSKTNAIYANPTGACPKGRTSIALGSQAGSISGIVQKVSPSVVTVNVTSTAGSGTGSGSIYFSDATKSYIVTNNHVVESAATTGTISVELDNGDSVPATIVGRDSNYDLAVLKIAKGNQAVIEIGSSSGLSIGDQVIAYGSPLGLDHTVTSGIVSSLNRPVTTGTTGSESYVNAIQTDAAINPGNSGGPLTDSAGRMVGVNSAIASLGSAAGSQSGSIGLGFSIPIDEAKRVINEIIATGKSTKPILGVSFDATFTGNGAKIAALTTGEAAQRAGIPIGSIVTSLDGQKITDLTSAIVRIRSKIPGSTISVTVTLPTGGTKNYTITLGSAPSN